MKIAPFEMERYQSRYWHQVDHDLSESGVLPMTIRELLGPTADAEGFLHTALGYPAVGGLARDARQHRGLVPRRLARRRCRSPTAAPKPTS